MNRLYVKKFRFREFSFAQIDKRKPHNIEYTSSTPNIVHTNKISVYNRRTHNIIHNSITPTYANKTPVYNSKLHNNEYKDKKNLSPLESFFAVIGFIVYAQLFGQIIGSIFF